MRENIKTSAQRNPPRIFPLSEDINSFRIPIATNIVTSPQTMARMMEDEEDAAIGGKFGMSDWSEIFRDPLIGG